MLIVPDDEFNLELFRLGILPPILKEIPKEVSSNDSIKEVSPKEVPSKEVPFKDCEVNIINEEEIVRIPVDYNGDKIEISEVIIEEMQRGRGSIPEVPSHIRNFIAEESLSGVPAKELSKMMDISESSISAYKKGATSTASYHEPDEKLSNHVDLVRKAISVKARGRLLQAIDSLTDDKISGANAKSIASIAKDMSAVVKNLEVKENENDGPKVQFVFFAPKVKSESQFPVIEVAD